MSLYVSISFRIRYVYGLIIPPYICYFMQCKFVSFYFSTEGKFNVEISTERLHTVPVDTVSSVCISCFLVHIYLAGA